MTTQQKEDLVCPFHGDLEKRLESIDGKLKHINDKLGRLLLWKAGVVGWAGGATFVIIVLFKLIGFLK
jgi:hypothetical protein